MVGDKAAERLGAGHGDRDLAVLVHARGAVAVELAELDRVVVLVEERVHARERQRRVVATRQQDEVDQARVELEHLAVGGVGQVALDDLAQDAVRGLGRALHGVVGALVEQARHERGVDDLVVHDGGGAVHVGTRVAAPLDVPVERVHDLEVLSRELRVGLHADPLLIEVRKMSVCECTTQLGSARRAGVSFAE